MIVKQLISTDILPLRTSDTGEEAIAHMNVYHLRHLPIVNNEDFLGLISEDDILNHNLDEAIGSFSLSYSGHSCKDTDHIFDAMQKLAEFKLSVIPIVDDKGKYLGLITLEDLLIHFASSYGLTEPGSIIVLDIARNDYSLSEIARIIEGENSIILASFITSHSESTNLSVSLKINTTSLGRVIASLQRFEYVVTGTFAEEEYRDILTDRYNSLMTYLNI